jgi:hypothetical protein
MVGPPDGPAGHIPAGLPPSTVSESRWYRSWSPDRNTRSPWGAHSAQIDAGCTHHLNRSVGRQTGPPHLQRCRRLPRPWPVVVPVLPVLLVPVLLLLADPVPRQRRRRVLRWRRWWPIGAASVVAGQLARYLHL